MTDDNRKHIAYYLGLGRSAAQIARELGRAVATIWREMLGRRVDSTKGFACSNRLGIRRIAGNQMTLHPFLLGQKFQRLADKAILRRNGVTDTKKQTPGK